MTRLLRAPHGIRTWIDRQRYRLERPGEVAIGFGPHRATMLIADEAEYAIIVSKREDYRLMGALAKSLAPGDVFWDIGANIGFYSLLGAAVVGAKGRVVSFEPEPASRARMQENLARNGMTNVAIQALALGDRTATLALETASRASAGVHRLVGVSGPSLDGKTIEVPVRMGDDLVAEGLPVPTAVKIDVEGAELAVLSGLEHTLADPRVKAVLVEVHFALLEARGHPYGALEVERRLGAAGLGKRRWLDRSHLLATR
ncbi:MAG: FkbM family methyltransferase [Myxococcota bacterium]